MSMIKCKECGTKISSKAEACPQCGFSKKSSGCLTSIGKTIGGIIGAIVGLVVISGLLSNQPDPHAELTNKCKSLAESYPNASERGDVYSNCISAGEAVFRSKGIK